MLRHAGIMAIGNLARPCPPKDCTENLKTLDGLANHDSVAVQIATCVALRKQLTMPSSNTLQIVERTCTSLLENFLDKNDPSIVLEAARAIHDAPVNSAMPALAELIDSIELHHDSDPCLLYTSPSPRDRTRSRMPSSA